VHNPRTYGRRFAENSLGESDLVAFRCNSESSLWVATVSISLHFVVVVKGLVTRRGDSNSKHQGSCYSSKGCDCCSGGTGFEYLRSVTQSARVNSG